MAFAEAIIWGNLVCIIIINGDFWGVSQFSPFRIHFLMPFPRLGNGYQVLGELNTRSTLQK